MKLISIRKFQKFTALLTLKLIMCQNNITEKSKQTISCFNSHRTIALQNVKQLRFHLQQKTKLICIIQDYVNDFLAISKVIVQTCK